MPNDFGQRLGRGLMDRANREVRGLRNATPGTRDWQWQQTLDAAVLPGNLYNSETRRWQIPGLDTLRNLFDRTNGAPQGQPLPEHMRYPSTGQPQQPGNAYERGVAPTNSWDRPPAESGPPAPNTGYGTGQGVFPQQGQPDAGAQRMSSMGAPEGWGSGLMGDSGVMQGFGLKEGSARWMPFASRFRRQRG